jgi:hypothetical protein
MTSVARVLRPGGSFVFVIGHPCFLAPHAATVRTGDGSVARVVNTLTACGFTLDVVDEPPAHGRLAAEQPIYSTVPIFFAARAIKA